MSYPDDGFGDWEDDIDDESYEPIGSCDECEDDLYEEDVYYVRGLQLCGRCGWIALGCPEPT